MGFFDTDTDTKARRFAERKGVDVGNAIAVGRSFEGGAERVMVVRPGVVEVHHLGKVGSLTRKGAGVVTLASERVGSVSTGREGITGVLVVEGSGRSGVEFRSDVATRDRMAEAIRTHVMGAAPAAPSPPAVPAGWYPAGGVQRYWDGSAWTDHTAPLG